MAQRFDLSILVRVADQFSRPIKRMGKSMELFSRRIQRLTRDFAKLQKKAKKAGKQLRDIGRTMAFTVTAPILAFGALTLRAAGNFEAGMNKVRAISGATGKEFVALREQAKELGRTTQFSASQAADAMSFLAMAGFNANQVLGAMPGTLELAASAQLDLATAADIVSNVLTGYRLQVSDLARVNDVLVKTFTSANTNLSQLGEAMKLAGPVAAAAGVEFEETTAALGLMGNAGFQASLAGTSLRGAMSRILNPSKQAAKVMRKAGLSFTDADGRLKSLTDIIRELEPVADDVGLFMEIFGQRAGPAMAALVGQGADALAKLTDTLRESGGTAARIAAVQMEGFNGAMKRLKSAFEGLQIAIAASGFLDFATALVNKLAGFLTKLAEVNPKLLKFIIIVGLLVAAIGPLLVVIGLLVIAFGALTWPITLTVLAITALITVGTALAIWFDNIMAKIREWGRLMLTIGAILLLPFSPVLAALAGISAAIAAVIENWDFLKEKFRQSASFFKKLMGFGDTEVSANVAQNVSGISTNENKSDVTIKVVSDKDSTATVEDVKTSGEGTDVKVLSTAFVGAN